MLHNKEIKRLFLFSVLALLILMMFGLVGCESGGYKEQIVVDASVVSKEYEAPRTYKTVVPCGKSVIPVTRTTSPKYLVTVTYDNLSLTIDSESIYSSVKNGDSIKVMLIKKYTAEGQLKSSKLEQL